MMYGDFKAGNKLHSLVEKLQNRQIVYDKKSHSAQLLAYVNSTFINSSFVSLQ